MKDYEKYKAGDTSPVDDGTPTYVIGNITTPVPDIGSTEPVSLDDEKENE